jgi:toxin HigB-1
MIRSFRSSALKRFWTKNDGSKISSDWLPRIATLLDRLDASVSPGDMNLPGFGFHALKGEMRGRYSVKVSGNFRVTFGWQDGEAVDVDLEDYH